MARLTSDIFASALTRAMFTQGEFGTIIKKGAAEAGAIFVVWRNAQNQLSLFGPAPQVFMVDSDAINDRRFELLISNATDDDIDQRIDKETRYDPDLWLVELEGAQLPLQLSDLIVKAN